MENPILFTSTAQARQARDDVRRATLAKRKRGFAYEYLRLLCVITDIINKKIDFRRNMVGYTGGTESELWRCTRCKLFSGALALHIELFSTWICTDCYIELNPNSILGEI